MKVAINGFGRIGKLVFRAFLEKQIKHVDIVAINDINDDVENLAYQLKYDSTHGPLNDHEIKVVRNGILFDGKKIDVFTKNFIYDVPWNDLDIDIVIGCSGSLENVRDAKNCLGDSVKKVIFSDSPKDVDFTFVMGVNQERYLPLKHNIIAGSICDVVGVAPLINHIESAYGIKSGFLLTLHPWLVYQNVLDGRPNPLVINDPNETCHAIGRGSAMSLIPKNTMSYRVPTEVVASLHAIFNVKKRITKKNVIEYFKNINDEPYFSYTEEPMVSVDYKHHPSSCIVDGKWIEVINPDILRIVTWYDNEWGYTSRLAEIIKYVSNYF